MYFRLRIILPQVALLLAILLTSCHHEKSLSEVDLESLLVQPGDLPEQLMAGSVKTISPGVIRFIQALEQEITTKDGEIVGAVRVYLFQSNADRDHAYELFSLVESQEGVTPYSVPSIGDLTAARYINEGSLELVFTQCQAVVTIWLGTAGSYSLKEEDVVHYAQQLDRRLASEICP